MKTKLFMALAVIFGIVIVALLPIASIWALNTLFVGALLTAEIPLNIWTYIAMLWITLMIGSVGRGNSVIHN